MKIHFLIETSAENAEREANCNLDLYRGIGKPVLSEDEEYVRLPIRTDRVPRDASRFAQLLFNALFEKAHGIKDIRNRSLFCTTDMEMASSYANGNYDLVVKVCPLKKATLAYAPNVDDSNKFTDELHHELMGFMKDHFDEHTFDLFITHDEFILGQTLVNSVQQLRGFLTRVGMHLSPEEFNVFNDKVQRHQEIIGDAYKIVPASSVSSLPDNTEVMVFDAAYFYATKPVTDGDFDGMDAYD